jgi:hypothetical protein
MTDFAPWYDLANSIVLRAIDDWKMAAYAMWENRGETEKQLERFRQAKRVKMDCEKFFRSTWFSTLCDLDSESVLSRLNEQHDRLIKAKISRRLRANK